MSFDFNPYKPFVDTGLCLQDGAATTESFANINTTQTSIPLINIFAPPAPVNANVTAPALPIFSTATNQCSTNTIPSVSSPSHSQHHGQHFRVGSCGLQMLTSQSSNAFTHSSTNSVDSDGAIACTAPLNSHHSSTNHLSSVPAPQPSGAVGSANLYVASLPASFTDEELYALFAPFGPIISSKVMLSKPSPNSTGASGKTVCRGYGFVLFKNESDASRAQAQMIGHVVGGNKIQVRRAKNESFSAETPKSGPANANANAIRMSTAATRPPLQLSPTALAQAQAQAQAQVLMPFFVNNPVGLNSPNATLPIGAANSSNIILPSPMSLAATPTPNCANSGSMFLGQDGRYYVLIPAGNAI